jgi:curved DNA-binding protein
VSTTEIKTADQARALLDLPPGAGREAVRAAFRRAVKAAHPDRGGDPAQFRRVIEAYRLLDAQNEPDAADRKAKTPAPARKAAPPAAAKSSGPSARATVRITVAEAFLGATRTVRLADGRKGKVKLPPGLRSGETARLGPNGEDQLTVSIAPEADAEVRGDDLWLTLRVSEAFLKDGGRLEVKTPFGRRSLWISRTSAARGLFRAPGEGLPATETRPRGHLYLRLTADPALANTPAKSLLRRFAAAWAA